MASFPLWEASLIYPMHYLLALEPATFQTIILAWVAAISAIVIGISIGLTKLAPYISDIITAFKNIEGQVVSQGKRLDRHNTRIDSNTKEITDMAKQMPNCP